MIQILLLLVSLVLILIAAEGFTNGVEAMGKKFSLSHAVVGSILAAVGTALPETILPIVAILTGSAAAGKEIGVGAILGAPFMLSTLAFFLVGLTVVLTHKKRGSYVVNAERESACRDLTFFIPMYATAVFAPLLLPGMKTIIAAGLILGYMTYVYRTIHGDSAEVEHEEGLHVDKLFSAVGIQLKKYGLFAIVFQVAGMLAVMIYGAHLFVKNTEIISSRLGFNPMLFALIIAPIATELPEKFNSITWTLKGKDSLAVGNVTGAMVFQSTFPVTVGLLMTPWHMTGLALLSAGIALTSAAVVLAELTFKKRISAFGLMFGGVLYLVYVAALIF
jgi:cation:H+ antiporter